MSTDRLRRTVLVCLLLATSAAAQPSATAESVVVLPADGATTALGGTNTVFGSGAFDALDQPALAAGARAIGLDVSWQIDRFVESGVDPWAVGVVFPLGTDDRRLPALTVAHRRLQGDDLPLGTDERLRVDLDHQTTSLGLAWGPDGGRWSAGGVLHAMSKSGVSRFTLRTAAGDTSVVPDGHDDLLFAASLGAVASTGERSFASGSWSLRAGAALRRVGEDVDVGSRSLLSDLVERRVIRRSAFASALAVGGGAHWWRAGLGLRTAFEVAWPLYDEAPDRPLLAAGVQVTLGDALFLRAGVRDDHVDTIMTLGAGLRAQLPRRWSVGLDVAREPGRGERGDTPDAIVVGVRLTAPIPGSGDDDDLDDLLDDLEDIDDWIDDLEPAPADTTTSSTSDQE